MAEYKITYQKYRDEIIRVIGVGKVANTWFLYTPLLKRIIENAILESRDEDSTVTVQKLFLSLLEEGDGVANRILLGMNIDVDWLYEKFADKMEIRGKEYSMVDKDAEEQLINPNNKNKKDRTKITKIFGSFIGTKED